MKKDMLHETDEKAGIRLNKFLSDAGYCSRREADRLIAEGRIKVDGKVAELGTRVFEGQKVEAGKKVLERQHEMVLIAFNKPRGIVCTSDTLREKDNIIDYIGYPDRIYPIGRLDKDSEGLILLTNDGSLVNHILKASAYHEKEYIVTVDRAIDDRFIKGMSMGVPIEDGVTTRKCTVKKLGDNRFSIVLTQGLNRQIRRMCQYFGYEVKSLKRIRVMNIRLGDIPVGKYRDVSVSELKELKRQFENQKNRGKR